MFKFYRLILSCFIKVFRIELNPDILRENNFKKNSSNALFKTCQD